MSARVLLAAVRITAAVAPNVALLALLTWLNRAEPAQADPVVVARLRLPPAPAPRPLEREPRPVEEPEPEEHVVAPEPAAPEPPVADIEPVALTSVPLAVGVPVMVRPIPASVRSVARRAPRAVRRAPPPRRPPPAPPRTLGSDEVDEPPRELRIRQPAYPDAALRNGIEGSATVRFLVDEEGRVSKVTLVDSRGSRLFGRAVLAVADSWRFTPARDEGRRVRVWALKTVHFRLGSGQ